MGGTANFSVTASGALPLSYSWNFNGTNIAGATNTSLTLTNVQLNQAGNYAVLVTNVYGSVLSSNAILTVNLPPSPQLFPADALITQRAVLTVRGRQFTLNGYVARSATGFSSWEFS